MFSKNFKFIVGVIFVLIAFYFAQMNTKKNKVDSQASSTNSQDSDSTKTAPATKASSTDQPPAQEYPATSKDEQVKKSAQETSETDQITVKDSDGSVKSVLPRNDSSIKELLDSKTNLDPAAEFAQLTPINLKESESSMLSGTFKDTQSKFRFHFPYDHETGAISSSSCIGLPNQPVVLFNGKNIQIRDDKNGYAAVLINSTNYLRLTYGFGEKRYLIGNLFQKSGNSWLLISDFKAFEIPEKDIPSDVEGCPFK